MDEDDMVASKKDGETEDVVKSIKLTLSIYEPISSAPGEGENNESEKIVASSSSNISSENENETKGTRKIYRLKQPITPHSNQSHNNENQDPRDNLKDIVNSIQTLRTLTNEKLTDLISKNGKFEALKEQRYLLHLNKSLPIKPLDDDDDDDEPEEEDEEEEGQ